MERKLFYRYLWSAILTSLSGILCVQIDGIIVSHLLGANAFAAIGSLMPLMQIQLTICLLIGMGGALQLAYAVGAKDNEKISNTFWITLIALIVCSLPFVALSSKSEMVASWFCKSANLLPLVTEYGKVLLLSAPIYLLFQGGGALVRSEGFPRRVLVAVVIANCLNIAGDLFFIKVLHFGLAGTAWSTTLSNIVAIVISFSRPISWIKPTFEHKWHLFGNICLAGAPLAIGSIAMFGRLSYLTTATSKYLDADGMIVLSLLLSVFLLVNLLAGGTAQALQPLAGQYKGQGDDGALYRTCARSLTFTIVASLGATLLVAILAKPLCLLYGVSEQKEMVIPALRIFSLCYTFFSLGYVIMVIHLVLGNRVKALVISVMQPLMLLPVYALFVHFFLPLVWWAFVIAEFINIIIISILSYDLFITIRTTKKSC